MLDNQYKTNHPDTIENSMCILRPNLIRKLLDSKDPIGSFLRFTSYGRCDPRILRCVARPPAIVQLPPTAGSRTTPPGQQVVMSTMSETSHRRAAQMAAARWDSGAGHSGPAARG